MGMSYVSFGQKSASKISKILSFTAVAAILAGCSGSVDRFADYPSIATNSVSKKETKSAAVDSVETTPLTGDRVATARPSWQNAPSPNAGYTPPAPVIARPRSSRLTMLRHVLRQHRLRLMHRPQMAASPFSPARPCIPWPAPTA
jgi:hypothetical protein